MTRIPSKKTKQYRIIKEAVNVGMSGNKIQKLLQNLDMGVRRKKLYAEIRSIKNKKVSEEKRRKSIPKKYRKEAPKKWKEKALKVGQIYRGSLIISSVPLHSRPFDRRYLGFRLNIFSHAKGAVRDALRTMKKEFIGMVTDMLKSDAYAKEQVMGIENPTKINVTNPNSLNGKWFFDVEEQGKSTGKGKDGYI